MNKRGRFLTCNMLTLIALISLSLCSYIKPPDCTSVKNGRFYYYAKSSRAKVLVERNCDTIQTEIDTKHGDTLISKIVWKTDCSYDLYLNTPSKLPLSKSDSLLALKPTTITITGISKDFYLCTVDFDTHLRHHHLIDTIYFQK
jgi:hypothetical protein